MLRWQLIPSPHTGASLLRCGVGGASASASVAVAAASTCYHRLQAGRQVYPLSPRSVHVDEQRELLQLKRVN